MPTLREGLILLDMKKGSIPMFTSTYQVISRLHRDLKSWGEHQPACTSALILGGLHIAHQYSGLVPLYSLLSNVAETVPASSRAPRLTCASPLPSSETAAAAPGLDAPGRGSNTGPQDHQSTPVDDRRKE